MPPKKKARTDVASWECENDDGWEAYAPADIALIEAEYVKGAAALTTDKLTFNKGYGSKYTFDFKAMIQLNNDSKKQRKIRRIAPLGECQWEWKDDSGLFVPFYDDDSIEIERLYAIHGVGVTQKTKKLSFNKGYDTMYAFTFAAAASPDGDESKKAITGTQKNEDSGNQRELRRIQKKLPWSIEGYGIAGATLPTAAQLAAITSAPASATVAVVPSGAGTAADDGTALLTRSSTLGIPQHWTAKSSHVFDASGAHSLVAVAPGTEEFATIAGAVTSTMGKGVAVSKIVRLENMTLWTFYALTRDQVAKRTGGNGNPNERLLFYGERNAKNIQTIQRFGFDTRVAEDGAFGIGLYFGVHARFCDSGRCLQHPDGSKDVLVCRATLGETTKGAKSIRRPPPRDPKKPTLELYNSCTDDKDPHELYVLFANSQVYPDYVVTYK
jgi:hypothetical protein